MWFQFTFDITALLTPIIAVIVLILLMVIMVYLYNKHRIFLPILTVYLFSMIIGVMSIEIVDFPFTPYFQTFFILFQTIFLLITSIQVFSGFNTN